jgi:valyl-tRNA synthetase
MTEIKTQGEMSGAYEPGKIEEKWYRFWLEKDYFKPKIDKNKEPFVIIMPPPNVTGELHMGHALESSLQDAMTRWHRMKGDPTLWLPGVDHAAIAAQVVVERQLAKEGTDRHKLGREKFLERMHLWVRECRHTITEQRMKLGASCDWSREKYTMDEGPSRAVRTTFLRLYEKGLIYRGVRITNWCPRCTTALSDLEVDHQDVTGHLWYIKYPLSDKSGYITVATTRPETILGDTAVAVNPDDERFKGMVGKKAILPILNREIPIVGDSAVELAFGTGAVKITPAHDPVDFEIAARHDLPLINILNDDGTMNENAGPYKGMDRFECREAILTDLEKAGLLVKIEPYSHAIAHCERCKTIVEPLASKQWFVKIEPLAKTAIEAVTNGSIRIVPEHFTKVYLNWMENIRDWCVSRQLWWGHRIPVWYCKNCGEVIVAVDTPNACPKCNSANLEQDQDVLDTWFSSGLWPHSTLGWPDDTEDFRYFYPTTVMETGYDLIFFWVARMIMMGIENTGEIPFHTIYFHGLIRDEKGEKMSKTRGNVIDPLKMVREYGTDALRFALITGTSPGNDSKLAPSKLEAGRNFANKLWNATRFVLKSVGTEKPGRAIPSESLQTEDRWILSKLNRTIAGVNKAMTDFQFAEAQRQIYEFLWGEYCDWYIELAKIRLRDSENIVPTLTVLTNVLDNSLRLLHPFMPFLTEELWQNIKQNTATDGQGDSIMVSPYPEADDSKIDLKAERTMEAIIEIIRSIRNARAEHNVENSRWIEARIFGNKLAAAITPYSKTIEILARSRPVSVAESRTVTAAYENNLVLVLKETEVVIPMSSMVDLDAEKKRLEKEIEQSQSEAGRLDARLNDTNFLSRAPAAVVEKERQKLTTLNDKLARLKQEIAKY